MLNLSCLFVTWQVSSCSSTTTGAATLERQSVALRVQTPAAARSKATWTSLKTPTAID